jgi:diamine N-acetyltransferase
MGNKFHLRPLEEKDAPGMLEWMTDPEIVRFFRFDASAVTLESCRSFIAEANLQKNCRHYAIADEQDAYLGTISLKNITEADAEYAISTRSCAHGTGAAMTATREILRIAFRELGLKRVYLNVLAENGRANAFYRKAGFRFVNTEKNAVEIRGQEKDLNWYEIER